ncbi:MAG: FAD-dependent monooxygenase [Gemmobacter sp.]
MQHVDVVIAGGGLNGPALALALAQAGLGVCVVDPRPTAGRGAAGFAGRAYALAAASQRLLAALGVWDSVAAEAQPILGVRTTDARPGTGPGPFAMAFDHAEIEEGPMGFMLEDRFLHAALRAAMAETPGIMLVDGAAVAGHAAGPARVQVALSDGRTLGAALLVGADGRGGAVAAQAGIARVGHDYGQDAVTCAIAHAAEHGGVARQVFLPGGPLAILPLRGRRSSIVWTERRDAARLLMGLDPADFAALLADRIGPDFGAITLDGARQVHPLALSLAESYRAARVVLVGDAAHGVHPIAGQGLNLGLRDVAALAEVLVGAHRRGEDIGGDIPLAAYERWRRPDATLLALGMDAVNRLFSNDFGPLRAVRGLGMAAVSALPGLRRAFIREAAGLAGDVPRLLTGRTL